MTANLTNVDVIFDNSPQCVIPKCKHGPALLFARFSGRDKGRRFYACSACRDRKDCSLFYWQDEWQKKARHLGTNTMVQEDQGDVIQKRLCKRFQEFKNLKKEDRILCQSCGLLLLSGECKDHKDQGHSLLSGITNSMLRCPTKLLEAKDDNKTLAQYLFSERTVQFIVSKLEDLHITHVLCIGAPRIHEAIQQGMSEETCYIADSLLLDLDSRYMQFYPDGKVCQYNMFNNFFFNESESVLDEFLTVNSKKTVTMVTDPPFGGMVQALAESVKKMITKYLDLNSGKCGDMPVFWFFPYFMEPKMKEYLPEFTMLDYKVDYENHSLYKHNKKKKGSPVRIFTNIDPCKICLPSDEGYWYCKICKRFSAKENVHCDVCDTCPSKDGSTYKHCYMCEKCVKPNRTHCNICKHCEQPGHQCGVLRIGCHICGSMNHKRKQCPDKQDQIPDCKRKHERIHHSNKKRRKYCKEKSE